MRSSLTEADMKLVSDNAASTGIPSATASVGSRNNSIDITAEETLNRLRNLEPRGATASHSHSHSRPKVSMGHMEKMGQSLNFLNLDRRSMTLTPTTKTVGGDNPREALMKLRIKRLSKKPTPTTATERLYQSDSALLGGGEGRGGPGHHSNNKANARDAVWFKSSYPTRHTLEKLEEAEQEFEESTHRSNSVGGDDSDLYGDMPELDDFNNTSSTDLWLHGNQSAPEDFQRRRYVEEDSAAADEMEVEVEGAAAAEPGDESGRHSDSSDNDRGMGDQSIRIV